MSETNSKVSSIIDEYFSYVYVYVSRNTQVKPYRSGLRTGWVIYCEYRREGPYVVLSFFLFFFAYCVVLFLKVYWKAYLALFRPPDLEKKKTKTKHKYGIVVCIQSTELSGETGNLINVGFPQCKTIIMPLIFQSLVPVSCNRRCLRCAMLRFCAPRFLVDVFSFVVHGEF